MRSSFKTGLSVLLLAVMLLCLCSPACAGELDLYEPKEEDAPEDDPIDGGLSEEAGDWDLFEIEPQSPSAVVPNGADAVICARAALSDALSLRLFVGLPADADPALFHATAGFGGVTTIDTDLNACETADGLYVLGEAAAVGPGALTEPVTVTLTAGSNSRTLRFTALDYLQSLSAAPDAPEDRSAWSGSIEGVGDFHAKLDLSGSEVAAVLCFRADSVSTLQIAERAGHPVSAPEQEGDGLWSVRVTGLTVRDLPADLVLSFRMGAEEATVQYSPFCWAAAHWDETDIPLIVLCRVLSEALA